MENKNINIVIPEVTYSDILLLEENGSYWIAERFFEGNFTKYNNNFGYISPENDEFNKFA